MAVEIERKFLVTSDDWRATATAKILRQGYLCDERQVSVRVRTAGEQAYLTVKGARSGATRYEYEYAIGLDDAAAMLDHLCAGPLIEKTRYTLCHAGHTWVIDEFKGANSGLVVAELELSREDEPYERPTWIGQEVTDDPRYLNTNLVQHPYRNWPDRDRLDGTTR